MFFTRQLSERDSDGDDEPFWILTVEFHYDSDGFEPIADTEVWTFDYPTLEEFASVVEGLPAFQAAMAGRPKFTEVEAAEL